MENYQGDLADIIRAGGGTISGTLGSSTATSSGGMTDHSWQFQTDHPINYQPCNMDDVDDFGHPFSSLRDPLILSDVDISGGSSSSFFSNSNSLEDDNNNTFIGQHNMDHLKKNSNNYFSKMLQISQNNSDLLSNESPIMVASPRLLKVPASSTLISANDHMISSNSSKATTNCLIENTGLQISSPRNTGIKRRKSQAKKVVCIPAPTPANSRPTGEIVPSDLWAWRKYGQKPIKGSPYPRGYYRCSSSKGCSARKQVERSRTDPNMLVITYTSEHNHPWPTQRNALAGSTRTQPAPKSTKTSPTGGSQSRKSLESSSLKEEPKENNDVENSSATVKVEGEMNIEDDHKLLTEMEMEDCDQFSKGFPPFESYRPSLPGGDSINNPDQDFFADLGEIESDPLNLLFITQGLDEKLESDDKTLDPFTFYDWTGNTNSNNNSSNKLFGDQAKS